MRILAERLSFAYHSAVGAPRFLRHFEQLDEDEQVRWMAVAVEAASLLEVKNLDEEEET